MTPNMGRANLILGWLLVLGLFGEFAVLAQENQPFRGGKILGIWADGKVSIRSGKETFSLPLQGIAMPLADQPGYQDSFATFDKLLRNQIVQYQVVTIEKVKYVRIRIGMKWANITLLEQGAAWHDPGQLPSESLAKAQDQAKANKIGLWKHDDPVPPWDWPQVRLELSRKQAAERWRIAREKISEEERTTALAIIDKAVTAMGGEEKLRGLSQLHWEFELTFSNSDWLMLYMMYIGAKPRNPPAIAPNEEAPPEKLKPNIQLWWTNDEQFRVDLGLNPALPSIHDPNAMASLCGYLLKDQLAVFNRRQVPGKEAKFLLEANITQYANDEPFVEEHTRRARRLLLGLLQLYPLHREDWLLRVAEPTADDDRPAILVATRESDSLTPNQPLHWVRLVFNNESGHLEEITQENDIKNKCRFSKVKDFNGIKIWTLAEVFLGSKTAIYALETKSLTPLPEFDPAILSLPEAEKPVTKVNNKK